MDRQVQQKFIRGINRRFDVSNQDDPTRVYTLQNARLQKRGETGQIARIEGYEIFNTIADSQSDNTFYDAITWKNFVAVLWDENGTFKITLVNTANQTSQTFNLGSIVADNDPELLLLEDTIFIPPFNQQLINIEGTWYVNSISSSSATVTATEPLETQPFGGAEENPESGVVGFLEMNSVYWYSVSIKYRDNHKTVTSLPQRVKITNTRYVQLSISTPADLDGGNVQIEIYRKKDHENFFLIDRVRVESPTDWIYFDTGQPKIKSFAELNYVWADQVRASEIVRDRMVFGGLSFDDRAYSPNAAVSLIDESDSDTEEVLIPGNRFKIYARKRFKDGILSPHALVDSIFVSEDGKTFEIDQQETISPDKEVGFYVSFDRSESVESSKISFPTLEIYNSNVGSILTKDEPEGDQDRPVSPHVFLGWSQLERSYDGSGNFEHRIGDIDYSTTTTDTYRYVLDTFTGPTGTFQEIMPAYLEVEIITGQTVLFKRIATRNSGTSANTGIYEIAWLDGLKEYITAREFLLKFQNLTNATQLSTRENISKFTRERNTVIGYLDTVNQQPHKFNVGGSGVLSIARTNRFYLVLSADSIFTDYNNELFNNEDVVVDSWPAGGVDLTGSGIFDLLNIQYIQDPSPSSSVKTQQGENYVSWEYDDKIVQPVPEFDLEDAVVYLGSTTETGPKKYPAGLERNRIRNFHYWRLPDHVIVGNLITAEDLEIFQEEYETLLIWSEPFVIGTGINGVRTFTFTNFKTLSQDFGQLIDLQYINSILLAFCERGVNQINVGETLTQQASGEVFVSSATFLTTDRWVLKHLQKVQKESIVQYENMLFMSDGKDVWQFIDGFKNITNGAITLDGGIASAGVDPDNKEYRITDQSQTWAYSLELGEWMGPYTYTDKVPIGFENDYFSVVGDDLVRHNRGNLFGSQSFNTEVESVALDLNNVSVDKLWRKFILQLDGEIPAEQVDELLEFSYGREYGDKVLKNLFEVAKKSNLFHIGITSSEQNSTQLYWQIRTNIANFTIRSFAYDMLIRNRP